MQSSTRLACSATLLLTVCHAAQAYAESYPARPIRFIVGFAPGGGNDILARMVGQKLTEQFGQSVVIDNRPGAGGNVGAELVSRALPDGYTILMMSSSHPIQGLLKRGLTYDPIRDFTPVAQLANYPYLLVIHPAVKAKSVMELVALAKSRAGQLNFVSSGNGSGSHLAGELFKIASGAEIVHVPYKGTAQAITDLLGGRVQIMFSPMPAVLPQVKSGHLRALAVTGKKRSPALPDMLTVAEAGVANFEVSPWYGVLAPARAPHAIVTTLNAKIQLILKMPDIGERLAMEGAEPVASTPESFARLINDEYAKWSKVIKQTGLTAE
jgi:tripartite-type tricarboxylate transporter receptor subunit TctC